MRFSDIRRDFFDRLEGRILIMCAIDVDAICSCKILQFLLESYNLQYSVAPVASIETLCKTFEEYRSSVDTIVTINFGNLINLKKLLKPSRQLKFFVIDSHRPIEIHNYFKNKQIKVHLNHKNEPNLKVPLERDIFFFNKKTNTDGNRHDDDDDDEDDDQDQEDENIIALLSADASDLTTEQLEMRRKLRDKLRKKEKLLYDYEEYHFYNRSVALIMYELAYYLSKSNNYLLWLGIVGLTYQFKTEKISYDVFEKEAAGIKNQISRNQVSNDILNSWTIIYTKDLNIDLYRKWSVYESLFHTPMTVYKFKLWNEGGCKDFSGFLAESGLKLSQAKNSYVAMELDFKGGLLDMFETVCFGPRQYVYDMHDLITLGFTMKCGFQKTLSSNDVGIALRAILESDDPKTTPTEKFIRAIQSLSNDESGFALLNIGFEEAKVQMRTMFELVKTLITELKVLDEGPFLHVDLQDHPISRNFARGESLMTFTRFLLNSYVSSKATRLKRRAVTLPMILFSLDYQNLDQTIVVGIPPLAQEKKRSFFAKAFQQAATEIDCELRTDLSETNLVRININQKNQLLEQMKIILE